VLADRTRPSTVRQVAAPKRGGVRLLTALDAARQDRYVSLVAAAAPAIESRLGPRAVANRVRYASIHPPRLRLEPSAQARERFVAMASDLCRSPLVVIADVEDCYPSIGPGPLAASLDRTGVPPGTTRALIALLGELSTFGVRGLPVGPVPSAVLANTVLASVDEDLVRADRTHIRWVDDVWVAASCRRDAERVLAGLRLALARLGLRPSARKTRIAASVDISPAGVSDVGSQYHRPAHAHPLPGVPCSDAVAPRRG
jgi:Reverse transcriptase (RNA-dependent DNA polymerase)